MKGTSGQRLRLLKGPVKQEKPRNHLPEDLRSPSRDASWAALEIRSVKVKSEMPAASVRIAPSSDHFFPNRGFAAVWEKVADDWSASHTLAGFANPKNTRKTASEKALRHRWEHQRKPVKTTRENPGNTRRQRTQRKTREIPQTTQAKETREIP